MLTLAACDSQRAANPVERLVGSFPKELDLSSR